MAKKERTVITGKSIEIKGSLARHKIVKKVVNAFIKTEYRKKGKGVVFRYPVENLPDGQVLYIARPGLKKNFDFKVEVPEELGLGRGTHKEIVAAFNDKKKENPQKFGTLLEALTKIYDCSENDVEQVLQSYLDLQTSFQKGVKVDVLLKVVKWMFIMEDIVYWDYKGRAMLYNALMEEV